MKLSKLSILLMLTFEYVSFEDSVHEIGSIHIALLMQTKI